MSVVVTGSVHSLEEARRIHQRLIASGIPAAQIETRIHSDHADDGHNPLGAAAIFGTELLTLPATGRALVGNSTTIDLGLEEFVEVFSSLDDDVTLSTGAPSAEGAITLLVRVPDGGVANRVVRILEEHGGNAIEMTPV